MDIFRKLKIERLHSPLSQAHIRLLQRAFPFFIQFENHVIGNTFLNLYFQKMNQFPNNSSGIESSLFENFQKDDFFIIL
ncbi:hypothetical protein LEP1GSC086_0335 [Leptospira weilii str. LNT 1234]|nr:hypothetical protein LEP1GSC086_0335 [Leptospira weilii str. LNT 1234]